MGGRGGGDWMVADSKAISRRGLDSGEVICF